MTKTCKRCEIDKPVDMYSAAKSNKDGYSHVCKACVCARNKEYWRTPVGRMSQLYAAQVVNSKVRNHPVPTYSRQELTEWAFKNGLENLVTVWKDSGFDSLLSPSVDRLDPNKGYDLLNIRLVTWNENNEKNYTDRKNCTHVTSQNRAVRQLSLSGRPLAEYASIANAARTTGITRININDVCRGKPHCKTAGGFLWEYA